MFAATAVDTLLASGGGFVAGVTVTLIYAKAQGYQLKWPWQGRPHKHRALS